ncbi:MAG TPA: acyl-CoA dehydrogenase family protein [Kofleriaceae bacterium]|nr:acyl-CoA dehydrogenase family protein [Kofleriaceae bacterium]
MNFDWSDEQKELRRTVVEFCRAKLPAIPDGERPVFSRETWLACARHGVLGIAVPARYGGLEKDALTAALVTEALGYGCTDLGLVFAMSAHVYACIVPLMTFGTEAQRERWLPRLVSGDAIAAHATTEPNAGSDIFRMSTRAERRGDQYVLTGIKCFTSNAPVADVLLVTAATDPSKGYFGLSTFLVEKNTPGLRLGKPYDKVGLESAPMSDVYLDDCIVPATHCIGSEGAGASVFLHSMTWERTCLLAAYVGAMERVLERTIAYAKERNQFGQPIGRFQGVSHRIADMKVRLESSRLLLYRAAWGIAHDRADDMTAALAKLAVSEAAVASALDAIQVHGAVGTMSGEVERFMRDAVPSRIFSGTSEIQRNTIARALGL